MLRRSLSVLALLFALCTTVLTTPASAAVYNTCSVSGCSTAKTAYNGWQQLGFPRTSGWYAWPYGSYNYTGGRFYNREGQLPAGDTFYEYDVNPRPKGAARDAERIVRDVNTGVVWYSPDHYANFYRIV
ncbi:ribonuclease domain-containing protein [Amycolatopsis taiwanensis]|uniref:Ribonuclease N1 n=1 Tax=Amycolatopsis taiwanensis TaxID=342230 RepID=A0A9W6VE20_9PSEU|nr:ribonuclease domain-containing protein [Amycolatopsis taiwanensis]GLY65330.1 ribonuclease N1 [Amycolatopsis taiwanensis]